MSAVSWKSEVITEGNAIWKTSPLRFASEAEAKLYVASLSLLWKTVRQTRVVESSDPINFAFGEGLGLPRAAELLTA
jgi:hypothetical protein